MYKDMKLFGKLVNDSTVPLVLPGNTQGCVVSTSAMGIDGALDVLRRIKINDGREVGVSTEQKYGHTKSLDQNIDVSHATEAKIWRDISSIIPLILSLSLFEGKEVAVYYIDLRIKGIAEVIQAIFETNNRFVFHNLKTAYFCLRSLGVDLPLSVVVSDTYLGESSLILGMHHHRYRTEGHKKVSDEFEESALKEESEGEKEQRLRLMSLAKKYNINHNFIPAAGVLQAISQGVGSEHELPTTLIKYSNEKAVVILKVYLEQVKILYQNRLLAHLQEICFPYALATAESEWNGIYVSAEKCKDLLRVLQVAVRSVEFKLLQKFNVSNPQSPRELTELFRQRKLLYLFRAANVTGFSFSDEALEAAVQQLTVQKKKVVPPRDTQEDDTYLLQLLQKSREWSKLLSSKLLQGFFLAQDGKIHADHRVLGADTGRTQTRHPALTNISRVLKPLVMPGPYRKVGDEDFSQIEIGVAADSSGDRDLIQDYNSGDFYVAGAKRMYKEILRSEELDLCDSEFNDKERHEKTALLRERIKTFCLAVMYNMTHHGIAKLLDCSTVAAKTQLKQFFCLYPQLEKYLKSLVEKGKSNGYAETITGLKRYRGSKGALSQWEKNWMRNMPIQGSAADLFKTCVIKLSQEYKKYDAQLVIQVHDSVVFTAPTEVFSEVAAVTKRIMQEEVEKMFPGLKGKSESNLKAPHCWNKDGKADSIEVFTQGVIDDLDRLLPTDDFSNYCQSFGLTEKALEDLIINYCQGRGLRIRAKNLHFYIEDMVSDGVLIALPKDRLFDEILSRFRVEGEA